MAEAGEGWAEGFELAEDGLIEAAETARAWVNPFTPEVEARGTTFDYDRVQTTRLRPSSSTATNNRDR